MKFLAKWLGTYWRWTWPLLGVIVLAIYWFIKGVIFTFTWLSGVPSMSGGDGSPYTVFVVSVVAIAIYRMVKGSMPPIWVTVIALAIPLLIWGFWLIQPEWYLEWRKSDYFLWTIAIIAILGWLTNYRGSVVRSAKLGLIVVLLTAVGIAIHGKYQKSQEGQMPVTTSAPSSRETTFIVTAGSEWSKVYRYQGKTVDHRCIGPQKRCSMMTESGIYNFTPEKSDVVPNPVSWARFKSLTESPENIKVTITR